jgi:hypothetical protein
MPPKIDVYRDWLEITDPERPLNYYQVLRLDKFEDDAGKIRQHYRKMNSHVRKYATGSYAKQSQDLLNELAKAMLCLTDVQRKREYDATLGREGEGEGGRRTLEEILLANKVIDQTQLNRARNYATAVGLETRDALVQQKMAAPEVVMMAYAESEGLPYIELADVGVAEDLIPQVPPHLARQHSCVPVMIDQNQLLMASPNPLLPDVEEELRLRFGMQVRTVLCTAKSLHAVVAEHYPRDAAAAPARSPDKSAPKSTPPKSASPKPAAPAKPEPTPTYLTKEEKIKRRATFGILGFTAGVLVPMIFFMWFRGGPAEIGGLDIPLALLLGGVAGGVGFAVAKATER